MKYVSLPRTASQRFPQDCLRLTTPSALRLRAGLWACLLTATLMLCLTASRAQAAPAEQEDALLALLSRIESSYAKIEDYSAVFRKQERVKEVLLPEESVSLKFKKPLQIYMKWIYGPLKEAIYVDGENNNKVVAHSDGVGASMTWTLDPKGSILKADNRHIITDIGFGFIISMMRANIPLAIKHDEIEITRMTDEPFEGRPSTVVEAKFSPKEGRKYYASRIVCHVDKEYLLPIGIACFDENDALLEQYGYKDVKINVGLTENDFSRKNPEYKF
jgi:outer membrane lipoprotein-sorting protein